MHGSGRTLSHTGRQTRPSAVICCGIKPDSFHSHGAIRCLSGPISGLPALSTDLVRTSSLPHLGICTSNIPLRSEQVRVRQLFSLIDFLCVCWCPSVSENQHHLPGGQLARLRKFVGFPNFDSVSVRRPTRCRYMSSP